MARTSLSGTKASAASAGVLVQFRAANAARDARVFEVGCFAATAVAGEVGFGRPAAIAITPATPIGPQISGNAFDNASGAGAALVDTTWATAPTAPAIPWRRYPIPGTIGAGIIWSFPNGIVVPAGGALVIHQFSALAVTYDWHFDFDE